MERFHRQSLERLADMRRHGVLDDDALATALLEAWSAGRLVEDEAMLERQGVRLSIAEQLRRRLLQREDLAAALFEAWQQSRLVEAVEIHRAPNVVRLG